MGLGVLAGAGALVDYWPTNSGMPATSAAVLPRPAVPESIQFFAGEIPHPLAPRPMVQVARATPEHQPVLAMPLLESAADFVVGAPVELEAPPLALNVAPVPAVDPQAVEVALSPAPAPHAETPPVALGDAADQRGNGFFSGALRKTRDGIVKTGVITGTSIADAFKGLFGAFKKVSPF